MIQLSEIINSIIMIYISYRFINYTAQMDYEHLLREQYFKDHASRFKQRFFAGILVFWINPVIGLGFGLLFWALFDALLNRKRGLDTFYVGTEAKTDKWFSERIILYKISKWVSLVIGLSLYFFGDYLLNKTLEIIGFAFNNFSKII